MRWETPSPAGWYYGFAWFPTPLMSGETIWLEHYRYYVNDLGVVTTTLPLKDK